MTRSDSRKYKTDLLALVSGKHKLVCGSETGHDAVVPVCDFFEGMMSLGPYRVPDAGRDTQRIWTEVPERVAKFQLGHRYRLPLWELVYHDCVVSYWYWGDYNNKLPALWDKRDQLNALYATPPMLMFTRAMWEKDKARFVKSYTTSAEITRACGYSEMTDHRFLTSDRDVQQTRFANGMKVTVNFGDKAFRMEDARELAAGGVRVETTAPGRQTFQPVQALKRRSTNALHRLQSSSNSGDLQHARLGNCKGRHMEQGNLATEKTIRIYLAVLNRAILDLRMRIRYAEPVEMQEVHDLLDAIHNIPEMLCAYGGWHVEESINQDLLRYDSRWRHDASELTPCSLMQALEEAAASIQSK